MFVGIGGQGEGCTRALPLIVCGHIVFRILQILYTDTALVLNYYRYVRPVQGLFTGAWIARPGHWANTSEGSSQLSPLRP